MARMMLCDAADDREAAYLVTDLANGDATAWCQEYFTDLCATVTRAAEDQVAADVEPVVPQDVDGPGDYLDAPIGVGMDGGPVLSEDVAGAELAAASLEYDAMAEKHREKLRRKLAERPDSAVSSLDVVPEPGSPRR